MAKSALYTPEDYCDNAEIQEQDRRANKPLIGEIFKTYNARLKRANAMDFDDILFNTNVLLRISFININVISNIFWSMSIRTQTTRNTL